MSKIDNIIKYICLNCIVNIIKTITCKNNCETYKCISCNNIYHYKNDIIYSGHDPECFYV